MMKYLALFALLCLTLAQDVDSDGILILNDKNFHSAIHDNKNLFLFFHSSVHLIYWK